MESWKFHRRLLKLVEQTTKRHFPSSVVDLRVDSSLCFNCGACSSVCPLNLIDVFDRSLEVREGCTNCGSCRDVCPVEAIEIDE